MAKASDKKSKGKDKAAAAKGEQQSTAQSKAPKADKQAAAATKPAASSGGLGQKIQDLKQFFEESKVELKKVTWPSRKETTATSIAVLVVTFVMAVFLGLMDMAWSSIVQMILS